MCLIGYRHVQKRWLWGVRALKSAVTTLWPISHYVGVLNVLTEDKQPVSLKPLAYEYNEVSCEATGKKDKTLWAQRSWFVLSWLFQVFLPRLSLHSPTVSLSTSHTQGSRE